MAVFPKFNGNETVRVIECIKWTWRRLRKVNWPEKDILARAFHESPRQMVKNGNIFYMNPCSLQTVTCAIALKKNGLKPRIVVDIQELPDKRILPHLSIELDVGSKPHFIDFGTYRTTFKEGPSPTPHEKKRVIKRVYIEGAQLHPDQTIHNLLRSHEAGDIMARGGYSLKEHVQKLATDAKKASFTQFQQEMSKIRARKGTITGITIPKRKTTRKKQ